MSVLARSSPVPVLMPEGILAPPRKSAVGLPGVCARAKSKLPAAVAAARAASQAVAVSHMGAHALGAAAYAVEAIRRANPDRREAVEEEIRWQSDRMSPEVRLALQSLPPIGENPSGPLAPDSLPPEKLA